jgi:hypothetical protein
MVELRVVVSDEIAQRLASAAAERGISAEELAAELLTLHAPVTREDSLAAGERRRLSFVGIARSGGRESVAERHDEIIREHFADRHESSAAQVSESDALPTWVGSMHSGRGDLSERHEEIVKGKK